MVHGQTPSSTGVTSPKSLALAILLATLFGPFGLFYATPSGAMLMLVVAIGLAMFTFGLGFFLVWPVCMVWAARAVAVHNRKVLLEMRSNER
jgi:hypothetical protein